jgi:hypothetical protein
MNRIAVDVDEVLVPFLFPMAKWRGLTMPRKEKYSYLYRDIFSIPEPESQKMVRAFYSSQAFKNLKPIPGAHKKLTLLREQTDKIYVVTGRQNIARETTEWWLDKYFPDIFDDLILTNSFTPFEIKKVDVCRSLALDTIIDDSIDICTDCISNGINAIHFVGEDVYPWCEETNISVKKWDEI